MKMYKAVKATCHNEIARIVIAKDCPFNLDTFNKWLATVTNNGFKAIEKEGILCFIDTGEKQYTAIPGVEPTGEQRFRICEITYEMVIRKI